MNIQEMLSLQVYESEIIDSPSNQVPDKPLYSQNNYKDSVHVPIMTKEIIDALNVRDGGFYIDCTFGEGGHTKAMLELGAFVLAIDRDKEAIENSTKIKARFPDTFFTKHASFSQLNSIWEDKIAPMQVDGMIMDLGFSSKQIESKERGFAFKHDAMLDMRFDLEQEMSAYTWLNKASGEEMTEVFLNYGQEKNAYKIAKEIVKFRKKAIIKTTFELVSIIEKYNEFNNKHAATRIFQAIRIHVNDEFTHIRKALIFGKDILKNHGALAVLTFHSLEDKIVKDFFANEVSFMQLPDENEIKNNPRARSAKLRWMIKVDERE